jgi:hypothetical protein
VSLSQLRAEVLERDGGCVWPGCDTPQQNLQLAHLTHRGMGGSEAANTPANTVMLCLRHHDCLDGRTGLGILRVELNRMLRYVSQC